MFAAWSGKSSEVCIVGGGPAGLSVAIALTLAGREACVIDRAVPPIDKACGEGLLPAGVAALRALGVNVQDAGWPLHGLRFLSRRHASVTGDFPHNRGLGLRRVSLHAALLARAERLGIKMLWGVKNVRTERGAVSFEGGAIRSGLIVGADGQNSQVRREAGLDKSGAEKRRFGYRRHYRVRPWSNHVEVYWAKGFQLYVTPTAADQVGVALLSHEPQFRLDAALQSTPALRQHLAGAEIVTAERGAPSVVRRLRRVCGNGYALVGDASGSVDAITGEGLSLAFQQAHALARAVAHGDLARYQRSHGRLAWKPACTGALLTAMGTNEFWHKLAFRPQLFRYLVAAFC